MGRKPFGESLSRAAEPHVDRRHGDFEPIGDRVRVVIEGVPQSQDLAVARGEFFEDRSQLSEQLVAFQFLDRHRLLGPHAVQHFRRLRSVSAKRTLGVILGQVPRHPQEPRPRVLNLLARLPTVSRAAGTLPA